MSGGVNCITRITFFVIINALIYNINIVNAFDSAIIEESSLTDISQDVSPPPGDHPKAHKPSYAGQDCVSCHSWWQLAGTVYTDAAGSAPVEGATVTVTDINGTKPLMTTTDSRGNFHSYYNDVISGTYLVTITHGNNQVSMVTTPTYGGCNSSGCHSSDSASGRVYINSTFDITIGTLTGYVYYGSSSTRIAGALVTLGANSVTTGADGTFTFSNISVGTYTLTITATGYDESSTQVTVKGATTVTQNTPLTLTDTTAPTNPSISIANGASSIDEVSLTLTLSASDNVGITAYYASEISTTPSANASGWVSVTSAASYSGTVPFVIGTGSGTHTVYVWFKDSKGNMSSQASDTIVSNFIPTLSEWGMLLLISMLLFSGVVFIKNKICSHVFYRSRV